MKIFTRKAILFVMTFAVVLATQTTLAAPPLPNPILIFIGQEPATVGGENIVRYMFDVFNKNEYPAEMFAAAPDLPPCGNNRNAARTWVDIYDQRGTKLNTFCALTKREDLNKIWFHMPADKIPPSYVFIEMTDRKTNLKYKSNLSDTVQ